jgi:hypothetical protein
VPPIRLIAATALLATLASCSCSQVCKYPRQLGLKGVQESRALGAVTCYRFVPDDDTPRINTGGELPDAWEVILYPGGYYQAVNSSEDFVDVIGIEDGRWRATDDTIVLGLPCPGCLAPEFRSRQPMPFAPGKWLDFIVVEGAWAYELDEDVASGPAAAGSGDSPGPHSDDYVVRLVRVPCHGALKRAHGLEREFKMTHADGQR